MFSEDTRQLIKLAYAEDCPSGDISSDFFVPDNHLANAFIVAKESGIFCGKSLILECIKVIDPSINVRINKNDGETIHNGDIVCEISGKSRAILKLERVMLNFIQRLSGIATVTRQFVDRLSNPDIDILDTRKTTPLFRELERYAVRCGGGINHRLNLSDMVLLKENHMSAYFSHRSPEDLYQSLNAFKVQNPHIGVEIEIESFEQLQTWDLSLVDVIMLDNFSIEDVAEAVAICKKRQFSAAIEISGGITLDTIHKYRDLPIDRISIGSLTHSVKSIDLSLLFH